MCVWCVYCAVSCRVLSHAYTDSIQSTQPRQPQSSNAHKHNRILQCDTMESFRIYILTTLCVCSNSIIFDNTIWNLNSRSSAGISLFLSLTLTATIERAREWAGRRKKRWSKYGKPLWCLWLLECHGKRMCYDFLQIYAVNDTFTIPGK